MRGAVHVTESASALAHLAYMKDGTIPELVAHWVAVEAYMRSNAPRLAHVRKIKFEFFCAVAPVRKSPSESYDQQRLEQTSRRCQLWYNATAAQGCRDGGRQSTCQSADDASRHGAKSGHQSKRPSARKKASRAVRGSFAIKICIRGFA